MHTADTVICMAQRNRKLLPGPPRTEKPQVSVIIPARNEEALIGACLDSVLESAQRSKTLIEVLVVVDKSRDRTAEIVERYGLRALEVSFGSRAKARNYGAQFARGHVITFLDADTLVSSDFFSETLSHLRAGPRVVWYRVTALEKSPVALVYFLLFNSVSRLRPLFSPAISTEASYFFGGAKFNENLRSFEDFFYLNQAWKGGRAAHCRTTVKTSMRRVRKFGYLRFALHCLRSCLNPFEFEWRPINE